MREKKQKQSECLPMGKEEIHYGASILHRGEIKLHGHLCTNMKQSPKYTVKLEHTHTLCEVADVLTNLIVTVILTICAYVKPCCVP